MKNKYHNNSGRIDLMNTVNLLRCCSYLSLNEVNQLPGESIQDIQTCLIDALNPLIHPKYHLDTCVSLRDLYRLVEKIFTKNKNEDFLILMSKAVLSLPSKGIYTDLDFFIRKMAYLIANRMQKISEESLSVLNQLRERSQSSLRIMNSNTVWYDLLWLLDVTKEDASKQVIFLSRTPDQFVAYTLMTPEGEIAYNVKTSIKILSSSNKNLRNWYDDILKITTKAGHTHVGNELFHEFGFYDDPDWMKKLESKNPDQHIEWFDIAISKAMESLSLVSSKKMSF